MWVRTRVRLKGRTAACCAAHRATTCCDAARRAAHHAAVRLTAARRAVSDAHDASPWCHPMRPRAVAAAIALLPSCDAAGRDTSRAAADRDVAGRHAAGRDAAVVMPRSRRASDVPWPARAHNAAAVGACAHGLNVV